MGNLFSVKSGQLSKASLSLSQPAYSNFDVEAGAIIVTHFLPFFLSLNLYVHESD